VLNRRHPGNWSNQLGSAHLQREVFEMVEGAIARRFTGPRRTFWRAAWRANVRARLALTLRARLKSGHGDAACAAWHGLVEETAFPAPAWIKHLGDAAIRRMCAGRDPRFHDRRQSVSPL